MTYDAFGMFSFLILSCAIIFFVGYGIASSNVIKLKENNWVCTTSTIVDGRALCSEYKLKETK